ncbi:MAG TPA: glycoside hydrolase family 2 TIM barrel-domain containing protein [Solirubrobacteraceae bacterium]|nr:glycoside hydrolase family 2 TIM barrel-domain containing protein [Solirubrobacteraceae bacterium]
MASWLSSSLAAGTANNDLEGGRIEIRHDGRSYYELTRRLRRVLAVSALLVLAASSSAHAQGPTYPASAPTAGALYRDGQTDRYLLGGTWLYRPDLSDVGIADGWWRNVAATDGWSPVTVPNAYNAGDFSSASMRGWVGWYRRDFTLPSGAFARYVAAGARRWIIRFESVNYGATVWLNGRRIGTHAGAYLPFEFDLNGLRPGVNRLIVRVDNRRGPTALPPGPGGLWWNYGGIVREVYLRAVSNADLAQVQVRPVLGCPSGCGATIQEQALVRNVTSVRQVVRLRGVYGRVPLDFGTATIQPHGTWTARATATIAHPKLWSIDRPTLYRATLTLSDSRGRQLGGYVTYSGIRSITVSRGHLELNGRMLHLRGVDLHEQTLARGSALQPADMRRLIGWVREVGANVIRTHYPLNPEIQEMADRYGILIWAEVPVYQVSTTNLANPALIAHAHAMLQQDILTNQNHPSVLLWSIGNELPTPVPASERRYIAGAVALAHRLDPTRPVGMAVRGWPGVSCQSAYAPLDVIGYNDYFGWFDAGGGTTDDRDALGPYLDSLRACYPTQALMITEFGFDANRDGPVEERGTYAFQSNAAAFHLGVFATKPWLSGAIYWIMQDFAAAPGWAGANPRGTPPFVQKGLVDLQGNLKPAFSIVAAIYHATAQIAAARPAR